MSISITDVNYSYPIASTIGSKEVSTNQDISGNSITEICQAYEKLFGIVKEDSNSTIKGIIEGKANQLLNYVNEILGKTYSLDQLEDIAAIFDQDDIISKSLNENNEYLECKEGLKAYKFYLKEVLTKLYNLHTVIKDAQNVISDLDGLKADTEEMLNDKAHALISELQIYDQQVQDIFKAFTEYSVVKNLTVTKNIKYNDGISDQMDQVDHRTYECVEKAYRSLDNLIDKTTGRSVGEYKDSAWLKTHEGQTWLNSSEGQTWTNNTLYGIQTKKYNETRTYNTSYYKNDGYNATNELTDKYDLLAQIKTELDTEHSKISSAGDSTMDLFDELTLLEKLQYIRIYYTDDSLSRYVYPENNKFGYPCIKPPESTDALNDTKELGQAEMFYLGYIMDRDGPINALASFLEIKTTAIKTQIKVLMERIKAIKAYSTLLQKGFEQFSTVAGSKYGSTASPIPVSAFYIYRYLSTSATRCFYYDDKGTPYIMVQYSYSGMKSGVNSDYMELDAGKGVDTPDGSFHESHSQNYILVRADEDGLNGFVNFLNTANMRLPDVNVKINDKDFSAGDRQYRALDILFAYPGIDGIDNHYIIDPCAKYTCCYHPRNVALLNDYSFMCNDFQLDIWVGNLCLHPASSYDFKIPEEYRKFVKFIKIENKYELPKELDVPKAKGTDVTQVNWAGDGMDWHDVTPEHGDDNQKKNQITRFFGIWQGNFETQIANYKTCLDQQEKEITSLQKKIQTFDATSTNFRNKAFTVYNRTVNKIK